MSSAAVVFDYQSLNAQVSATEAAIASITLPVDFAPIEIARAIAITDETYGDAEQQIVVWKLAIKQKHDVWDPVCADANQTHKRATSARASEIAPLEDAANLLSRKLGAFLADKRRAGEEAARLEAERVRLISAQQREAEIESAEANNASPDEIQALCDMPLPPIVVSRQVPSRRSSPVSLRQVRKARVTNHLALVKHIAGHPQFLNLIPVDQAALNKFASALGPTAQLPGVEFYVENAAATRTAARRS